MATIPVEYRLMSLEFRNGLADNERRLGFRSAVLLHDPGQNAVVIEGISTPEPMRSRLLANLSPFEIESIRYEIRAGGYPPIPFCHPFPRGTDVRLSALEGNPDQLYLSRRKGRRFFSDNFTLRGVTNGRINSGQNVYQFHE
jgi:hypothetical protein